MQPNQPISLPSFLSQLPLAGKICSSVGTDATEGTGGELFRKKVSLCCSSSVSLQQKLERTDEKEVFARYLMALGTVHEERSLQQLYDAFEDRRERDKKDPEMLVDIREDSFDDKGTCMVDAYGLRNIKDQNSAPKKIKIASWYAFTLSFYQALPKLQLDASFTEVEVKFLIGNLSKWMVIFHFRDQQKITFETTTFIVYFSFFKEKLGEVMENDRFIIMFISNYQYQKPIQSFIRIFLPFLLIIFGVVVSRLFYIFELQKMDEQEIIITLSKQRAIFCSNYNQPCDNLFIIFGHSKAGKSVFIDLLAGQELILYQNIDLMTQTVVSKYNCGAYYPPIYLRKAKEGSTLLLQSFQLDTQPRTPAFQVVKLIFLKQLMEQAKRISMVILVEEVQKDNTCHYFERFLQCIGMTSNDRMDSLDIIKDCVYLMVTKKQEGDVQEEILRELAEDSENQNVKEILNHILDQDRIQLFRIKDPESGLGEKIKAKFQPKSFNNKQLLKALEESVLKDVSGAFQQQDQQSIMEIFNQTVKLGGWLLRFAISEEQADQREYEKLVKNLYPDDWYKNQARSMLGEWNRLTVSKLNLSQKINALKSKEVNALIEVFKGVLRAFEEYSKTKNDYEQIIGDVVFISSLIPWFSQEITAPKISQAVEFIKNALNKASEIEDKLKIQEQSKQAKSEIKSKPMGPVKKINPFLNSFLLTLKQCKNNKDAIQKCIASIKQKEQKEKKTDNLEVIFYIKLLKHLLEDFDEKSIGSRPIFIRELIELALYSDNDFDLERYLSSAILTHSLTQKDAFELVKVLLINKKTECCEQMVDYLLAESTEEAAFERLAQIKVNLKGEINKKHINRETNIDSSQQNPLSLRTDELFAKINSSIGLQKYLVAKDYQKYINKE